MRITKVDIPADDSDGLSDIKMEKISNLVIIAGKNGSGKSRLLRKIKRIMEQKPKISDLDRYQKDIKMFESQINYSTKEIEQLEKNIQQNPANSNNYNEYISNAKRNIENAKEQIKLLQEKINWSLIDVTPESNNYSIVEYVPKSINLRDPRDFNKNSIYENTKILNQYGINPDYNTESLALATFLKIQDVQDKWFNSTHQNSTVADNEKEENTREYEKLKEYIKIFLNTELNRDQDGDATVFNLKLGKSNLSDGQKVLMQFCILIFSQEKKLNELTIFLDEPENHLHPSVIIEVLDRIVTQITNGQIWIATHSIPLLAHFESKYLWFMDQGKISYAGNETNKVLSSLLGNEDEIDRIAEFLTLPAQLAINQFAYECLFNPKAVLTPSQDRQVQQIEETLKQMRTGSTPLKILDFGAGKGRLLYAMNDRYQDKILLKSEIDYIAYDPCVEDSRDCQNIIEIVYGSSADRYFNDLINLEAKCFMNSFDIIILCNVFHEIDAKDWLELFKKDGKITNLLKVNGRLLIVENQLLSIGEKAFKNGFLVYDELQFRQLFELRQEDVDYITLYDKERPNLKAHLFPHEYLTRINPNSRIASLQKLHENSIEHIKQIRLEKPSVKNGRLHAFWAQQSTNALLALREFGN